MKNYLCCLFLLFALGCTAHAQTYQIGETSITFNDASRSRSIDTEIFYPTSSAGQNVPIASGAFPVLIFGHGFVMGYDSYENFNDEFVPQGYILVFPTTEGGLSPDHLDFGKDLAFLVQAMQNENSNMNSIFNGAVMNKTALMGHSMGGGASVLAAEIDTLATTLVNFAAAETNPSAITAAASVTIPALLLSGSEDCVTAPATNQIAMYNALLSDCKTHISITGGGHCYFANYNFNCTFGESTCLPIVPLDRADQQDVTNDFVGLWLDYTLRGNQNAFSTFNDSLAQSSRITYLQNCTVTGLEEAEQYMLELYPNPADQVLYIRSAGAGDILLMDLQGKEVLQRKVEIGTQNLDISKTPAGCYILQARIGEQQEVHKVIIR